jgi:Protein of unknown function (DUF1329)
MNHSLTRIATIIMAVAALSPAIAAGDDVAELGKSLTYAGSEKAASADGNIPAWTGAEPPLAGWTYGKYRGDYWPHKDDKPILTIDASNADKYAEHLTAGQMTALKQLPGYKMFVYPSHRDCGIPDFVGENTKKNVGQARLEDGWILKDTIVPGFPFPFAKNGAEAMLNQKMRYRGVGLDMPNFYTYVSPHKGGTEWIKANEEQYYFYPQGAKGSTPLSKIPPVEYFTYFAYFAPTALAGQAAIVNFYLNQPGSETFYYFPGQRRVRRMPTYAYDAPQIGMENQYTMDEPMVFMGTIDRFDWKILGKKEIYVAYNSFGAYDINADIDKIAQADYLEPGHRHYELHRVWVVEATVKQGMRHTAPKRQFFLDEDSWNVILADDYDAQGKLFKHRDGYLIPVYETGSCDLMGFTGFNFLEGRYVYDESSLGGKKDFHWLVDPTGPRQKASYYTQDNLRAISER